MEPIIIGDLWSLLLDLDLSVERECMPTLEEGGGVTEGLQSLIVDTLLGLEGLKFLIEAPHAVVSGLLDLLDFILDLFGD